MDKEIKAIDITLNKVKSNGVAYYRLTRKMKDFMDKCLEKNDIIGFISLSIVYLIILYYEARL